jgi:hypothetical protein
VLAYPAIPNTTFLSNSQPTISLRSTKILALVYRQSSGKLCFHSLHVEHIGPEAGVLEEVDLPLELDIAVYLLLQSQCSRVLIIESVSDFDVVSLLDFDLASLSLLQRRRRHLILVLIRAGRASPSFVVLFFFYCDMSVKSLVPKRAPAKKKSLTFALLPLPRRRRLASRLTLDWSFGWRLNRRVVFSFALALAFPAAAQFVPDNSPLIASVFWSFDVGGASDGVPVGLYFLR